MSAEVIAFRGITTLETDPARVLQAAIDNGLTEVVVVGLDAEGEPYLAASTSDMALVNWRLDRAKRQLLLLAE